jgi:HEPN domain-containing protein
VSRSSGISSGSGSTKRKRTWAAAEILAASEMPDYSTCTFHCQQAIEKFIKAYLVRHQIEFPKTHNLGQLLTLASQAESILQEELSSCEWLTPFGVEFRYPGEYPEVDQVTAQRAVSEARRARQVILGQLKAYLSPDT